MLKKRKKTDIFITKSNEGTVLISAFSLLLFNLISPAYILIDKFTFSNAFQQESQFYSLLTNNLKHIKCTDINTMLFYASHSTKKLPRSIVHQFLHLATIILPNRKKNLPNLSKIPIPTCRTTIQPYQRNRFFRKKRRIIS